MKKSLDYTGPLDIYRRRRGAGAVLRDGAQAREWARTQKWWPRVVEIGNTKEWWIWKCTP